MKDSKSKEEQKMGNFTLNLLRNEHFSLGSRKDMKFYGKLAKRR